MTNKNKQLRLSSSGLTRGSRVFSTLIRKTQSLLNTSIWVRSPRLKVNQPFSLKPKGKFSLIVNYAWSHKTSSVWDGWWTSSIALSGDRRISEGRIVWTDFSNQACSYFGPAAKRWLVKRWEVLEYFGLQPKFLIRDHSVLSLATERISTASRYFFQKSSICKDFFIDPPSKTMILIS